MKRTFGHFHLSYQIKQYSNKKILPMCVEDAGRLLGKVIGRCFYCASEFNLRKDCIALIIRNILLNK